MSRKPTGPLGPDHLVKINQHLAQLQQAKDYCERAMRAGYDFSTHHASATDLIRRLQGLKQEFFTGRQGS